jgi:hypothetical protein
VRTLGRAASTSNGATVSSKPSAALKPIVLIALAIATSVALVAAPASAAPCPTVKIAGTPTGRGYYTLDSCGEVNTFGDARYFGNAPTSSATSLVPTRSGAGYWIMAADGGVQSESLAVAIEAHDH